MTPDCCGASKVKCHTRMSFTTKIKSPRSRSQCIHAQNSCPGHNSSLPYWIWVIFYNSHMAKISLRAITFSWVSWMGMILHLIVVHDKVVVFDGGGGGGGGLFSFSHCSNNRFFGFSPWILRGKIWNFHRILNIVLTRTIKIICWCAVVAKNQQKITYNREFSIVKSGGLKYMKF